MSEIKTFQDYVTAQRTFIQETVDDIMATEGDIDSLSIEQGINFRTILAMYLSPESKNRQDQLITVGIDPEATMSLDLNGSQKMVALKTFDYLRSRLAQNYRTILQNIGGKLLNNNSRE